MIEVVWVELQPAASSDTPRPKPSNTLATQLPRIIRRTPLIIALADSSILAPQGAKRIAPFCNRLKHMIQNLGFESKI
jgi:hypothetical protein